MTRKMVYDAWTKRASSDLAQPAPSHGLARGQGLLVSPGSGVWQGAATRVDLSRELFRPPAGWSARAKDSCAWIGHRFARLCLLEDPSGARVLYGVVEHLAGSRWLSEALGRRLGADGLDVGRVFLACTHTHGAAGSVFGDPFYDSFASGLAQRFDALGAKWLEERLVHAARGLVADLEPITLGAGDGILPHGLLWQRAIGPYIARFGDPAQMTNTEIEQHSRRGHPPGWEPNTVPGGTVEAATLRAVDPRVPVWTVRRTDGSLLFASGVIHATGALLQAGAEALSSDVVGAAALELELRLRPPGHDDVVVALAAGAHADANISAPSQRPHEVLDARASKRRSAETLGRVALRYMRHCGRIIADAVELAVVGDAAVRAPGIEVRYAEAFAPGAAVAAESIDVPIGEVPSMLSTRKLPASWDFGAAVMKGSEFSKPNPGANIYEVGSRERVDWIRGHVDTTAASQLAGVVFMKSRALAFVPFVPLRIVRLGPIVWVGMSAEPSLPIADRIESLFAGSRLHLCGSAGGYCGYADTVGAAQMGEYEGASSYWGRDFGAFVVQQLRTLRDASGFVRSVGSPAANAWIHGGELVGADTVRGTAYFSLGKRSLAIDRTGPGRPQSGPVSGFTHSPAIPISSALPPGGAFSVRGHWRPTHAAAKRPRREDVSWPRPSENGPRIAIDLEGGGKVFSDRTPMLVRWDGDLWVFEAELDRRPLRFTVIGDAEVLPMGSAVVPFTG